MRISRDSSRALFAREVVPATRLDAPPHQSDVFEVRTTSPVLSSGSTRDDALRTIAHVTQQAELTLALARSLRAPESVDTRDRARLSSRLRQLGKLFRDLPAAFAECSPDRAEDRDRYRHLVYTARRLDSCVANGEATLHLKAELDAYWSAFTAAFDPLPMTQAIESRAAALAPLAAALGERDLHEASAKVWSELAQTIEHDTAAERSTTALAARQTQLAGLSLDPLLAHGRSLIPDTTRAFAIRAKTTMQAAQAALADWHQNATPETSARLRELYTAHSANLDTLSAMMRELRTDLIERSALSQPEAAQLADTLILGSGIDLAERVTLKSALTELIRLTEGRGLSSIALLVRDAARAHTETTVIDLGAGPPIDDGGLYHEYGHHLGRVPALEELTRAWLERRATSPELKPLKEIDPHGDYADGEVGFADHFMRPYIGRVYDHGDEVMSTGFEAFSHPELMARLLVADEEHFALVLGGLRS